MLLPPASLCDHSMAQPKPQRPTRPKLLSFERYDPRQRSQSPVIGLIASCRALQSILGERFSATPSPSQEINILTPPISSPFGEPTPPPICPCAPRRANKRSRSQCEEIDEHILPVSVGSGERANDVFSTPKRRRIVPLELPPGLQASDFEALGNTSGPTQRAPRRPRAQQDLSIPKVEVSQSAPESEQAARTWTENDDRILVETVLSKLNLSSREWNDCARRLGKDKDTIGRRWRMLLGEGNVGLRRGSRHMERVDLDIRSW